MAVHGRDVVEVSLDEHTLACTMREVVRSVIGMRGVRQIGFSVGNMRENAIVKRLDPSGTLSRGRLACRITSLAV